MWTDNNRNAKIKGDQIEMFKILNGYENIDCNMFFEYKITRGHWRIQRVGCGGCNPPP